MSSARHRTCRLETHRIPRACPARRDAIQGHADGLGYLGIEAVTLGLLSAELPPRQAASLAGRLATARTAADTARATLRRAPDARSGPGSSRGRGPARGDRHPDRSGHPDPRMQALDSRLPDAMGLDDLITRPVRDAGPGTGPVPSTPPGTSDAPVSSRSEVPRTAG